MNRKISKLSDRKIVTGILAGVFTAVALSLALTAVITSIVLSGGAGSESADIAIWVVRALSVFIGCLIGTGLHKEKILLVTAAVAGAYLLLMVATGILIFDGAIKQLGSGVLSVVVGGVGCGVIRLSVQNKPRYAIRNRV